MYKGLKACTQKCPRHFYRKPFIHLVKLQFFKMVVGSKEDDLDRNYPQVWTTQVIVVYAMKSIKDDANLCHDIKHVKFFLTSDKFLRDQVRGIVADLYVKYQEMTQRPYEAAVFEQLVTQLHVSEPGKAAEARYKQVLENIFVDEVNWNKIHVAIMVSGKYFYIAARLFDDERMKMILHWTIQYFMLPKIMNFIIHYGNWPLQTPGFKPSPRLEVQDLVKDYFSSGDDGTIDSDSQLEKTTKWENGQQNTSLSQQESYLNGDQKKNGQDVSGPTMPDLNGSTKIPGVNGTTSQSKPDISGTSPNRSPQRSPISARPKEPGYD